MKKTKIILILLILSSTLNAIVFGGTNLDLFGYKEHTCTKPTAPYKPYSFSSQWEVDSYNDEVAQYKQDWNSYVSCINEYIDNGNNDIKRIKEKQQEAIDEANANY